MWTEINAMNAKEKQKSKELKYNTKKDQFQYNIDRFSEVDN